MSKQDNMESKSTAIKESLRLMIPLKIETLDIAVNKLGFPLMLSRKTKGIEFIVRGNHLHTWLYPFTIVNNNFKQLIHEIRKISLDMHCSICCTVTSNFITEEALTEILLTENKELPYDLNIYLDDLLIENVVEKIPFAARSMQLDIIVWKRITDKKLYLFDRPVEIRNIKELNDTINFFAMSGSSAIIQSKTSKYTEGSLTAENADVFKFSTKREYIGILTSVNKTLIPFGQHDNLTCVASDINVSFNMEGKNTINFVVKLDLLTLTQRKLLADLSVDFEGKDLIFEGYYNNLCHLPVNRNFIKFN